MEHRSSIPQTFTCPESGSLPGGANEEPSHALNRLQAFGELVPILHHDANAQPLKRLRHLLLLLAAAVAPDVADGRNTGANGTQCPALAVLHRHALPRLLPNDLAGVEVDGRIGLGGRNRERSGGAEDVVFGEVFGLVDFFDAGHDAAERAGADDGEPVLLVLVQLVEFFGAADAGLGVLLQFGNYPVLFHGYVLLQFRAGDGEVEFLLQVHDHAAEVLADEVVEEFGTGVAVWDVIFGEDLVGEVGAGFEGEFF